MLKLKESQVVVFKEIWKDEYLKTICAFANSEGGALFIGVSDDGQILGIKNSKKILEDIPNKILSLLGILSSVEIMSYDTKEVVKISVEKSKTPISLHGVYFVRSGSTNQKLTQSQVFEMLLRNSHITWDAVPMAGVDIKDLDLNTINTFLVKSKKSTITTVEEIYSFLETLNLIKNNEITRAAIFLFGKNPQLHFPSAVIKIGKFVDRDPTALITSDILEYSIFDMVEKCYEVLISKYLRSNFEYEGLVRKNILEYSEKALREALLNAIIHRNYQSNSPIFIRCYENNMSIWNDGELLEPLTLEDLYQEHPSKLRNPLIGNVFYIAGYVETWGRGTLLMSKDCLDNGYPEPVFSISSGGFCVDFKSIVTNKVTNKVTNNMTANQENILNIMRDNPNVTISEISDLINISVRKVKENIKKLKQNEYIIRQGGTRQGKWEVL